MDGQWPRLGEALKTHGQLTLDAAWALFLADDFAKGKDFPPGLFIGQLDRWISDVHAAAAKARTGSVVDRVPGSVATMPAHLMRRAETHHATLVEIGDSEVAIPRSS